MASKQIIYTFKGPAGQKRKLKSIDDLVDAASNMCSIFYGDNGSCESHAQFIRVPTSFRASRLANIWQFPSNEVIPGVLKQATGDLAEESLYKLFEITWSELQYALGRTVLIHGFKDDQKHCQKMLYDLTSCTNKLEGMECDFILVTQMRGIFVLEVKNENSVEAQEKAYVQSTRAARLIRWLACELSFPSDLPIYRILAYRNIAGVTSSLAQDKHFDNVINLQLAEESNKEFVNIFKALPSWSPPGNLIMQMSALQNLFAALRCCQINSVGKFIDTNLQIASSAANASAAIMDIHTQNYNQDDVRIVPVPVLEHMNYGSKEVVILSPKQFEAFMIRNQILCGLPGTGKTLLIQLVTFWLVTYKQQVTIFATPGMLNRYREYFDRERLDYTDFVQFHDNDMSNVTDDQIVNMRNVFIDDVSAMISTPGNTGCILKIARHITRIHREPITGRDVKGIFWIAVCIHTGQPGPKSFNVNLGVNKNANGKALSLFGNVEDAQRCADALNNLISDKFAFELTVLNLVLRNTKHIAITGAFLLNDCSMPSNVIVPHTITGDNVKLINVAQRPMLDGVTLCSVLTAITNEIQSFGTLGFKKSDLAIICMSDCEMCFLICAFDMLQIPYSQHDNDKFVQQGIGATNASNDRYVITTAEYIHSLEWQIAIIVCTDFVTSGANHRYQSEHSVEALALPLLRGQYAVTIVHQGKVMESLLKTIPGLRVFSNSNDTYNSKRWDLCSFYLNSVAHQLRVELEVVLFSSQAENSNDIASEVGNTDPNFHNSIEMFHDLRMLLGYILMKCLTFFASKTVNDTRPVLGDDTMQKFPNVCSHIEDHWKQGKLTACLKYSSCQFLTGVAREILQFTASCCVSEIDDCWPFLSEIELLDERLHNLCDKMFPDK